MTPEYFEVREKLINHARFLNANDWSPTPSRKECERVSKALNDVADLLNSTSEGMTIESKHKERGEPETTIGSDGWTITEKSDFDWPGYESIKWTIRDLAESAKQAAEALPNPRESPALPYAAMGLLYIRYHFGLQEPTSYIDGEGLSELEEIANKAGIYLSKESYSSALKKAKSKFDPHYYGVYDRLIK